MERARFAHSYRRAKEDPLGTGQASGARNHTIIFKQTSFGRLRVPGTKMYDVPDDTTKGLQEASDEAKKLSVKLKTTLGVWNMHKGDLFYEEVNGQPQVRCHGLNDDKHEDHPKRRTKSA